VTTPPKRYYEQTWFRFDSTSIRKNAPQKPGIFMIRIARAILVAAETSALRKALLEALPPLGSDLRLSRNIAERIDRAPAASLDFSFLIIDDTQEREALAARLITAYSPASNNWA